MQPRPTWIALLLCYAGVALRPIATLVAQPWQVQALSAAMAVFSTVLPVWLVLGEALGALQLLGVA